MENECGTSLKSRIYMNGGNNLRLLAERHHKWLAEGGGSFKNNRKLFPTWSHTLFFCLISYCERQGGRDLIISGNNKKSNMYNGPTRVHIDLLAMCIIDAGSRRIPLSDPPQSNWKNLLFFLYFSFFYFTTLSVCVCVCVLRI